MRRLPRPPLALTSAWLAVLLLASPALAAPPRCDMREVTANGTTPIFRTDELSGGPMAWLVIANAGSGTVSVAVNIYGPPIVSGGEGLTAGRPKSLLCTLNAAVTSCGTVDLSPHGMEAVVTGCTGTCDLFVGLCIRDE